MKTLVTKAVIPVAGFGTRMLPAAKAVPKELLPIVNKPTVQYVVEEAAVAGIADVLLITGRDKTAIENHFDTHAELEERLRAGGKLELLASIDALMKKVQIHSVRQPKQRGLGDAVNQARRHVGEAPFICMLGDTIFSGAVGPATQLIEAYAEFGTTIVGLEEVPAEKVSRYGIVGGKEIRPGVIRIDDLVEKPSLEKAPSRLAIAARYVLAPGIFDCLDRVTPGAGGEIQLTDAIKMQLAQGPMHGVVVKAKRHDIGNPIDWLKTNLTFAASDAKLWKEIEPLVRSLLK